jgi:uncharacterized membrane protein YhhN
MTQPTLPDEPGDVLDALERLVDQHGLGAVLWLLADLCAQKADSAHDQTTASRWTRAAKAVNATANKGDLP